MPANRNALIRYKTIDNCLRNPYRRWTLEDLVDACSDALYEYEGIDKGISKRTVQMDIQMMRSEKLGYNAPIVVYENKYYKYEDPEYSITQTPLNEQDLKTMSEAVEVLRQFKGFSYFTEMSDIINRLEDHVASARMKTTPVIDFEKNESLKGLDYLDTIYHAIVNEHPIQLKYRSFGQQLYFLSLSIKRISQPMVRLWCQRKRTDLAKFSFGQNTIIGSSATRTLHKKYVLRSEHILR